MVLGSKYPSKERDGPGTGIGGSRNLCLLFSLLLLNRGPDNLISFSFGGPGTDIGGSRKLCLPFSLLLLNRGPDNLVSFSFGGSNVS